VVDEQRLGEESSRDRRRRPGLHGLSERLYALRESGSQWVGSWNPPHHKAQVVSVYRRQLDPAAVEVAAVFPLPAGRYRHRRVRCSGSDLNGGLTFPLFNPDPDRVVRGGGVSVPLWVQDQDFDTLEEAFRAAEGQVVPADPDGWLNPLEFHNKVQGLESLGPEVQDIGALGWVIVGAASLTAYVAFWPLAAGLDPELFREEGAELVASIVLMAFLALFVAWVVGVIVAEFLTRRHLAWEIARRGPHDSVPGNAPQGGSPAGVQGSTDNSHAPPASTLPHDIQDTAEDPEAREPGPIAAPSGSTEDDISDS
jgi:hypothetical protein